MTSEYKSPDYKLIKCFRTSRDKWKAKAQTYQDDIKNMDKKLRYHKNRRTQVEDENKQLKAQLAQLSKELEKKKSSSH